MWPQPSADELEAHFAGAAYCDPDLAEAEREKRLPSYRRAIALLQRHGGRRQGRVCDFGSALGHGLSLLQAGGYDAVGVEVDEKAANYARERGLTVYGGSGLAALPDDLVLDIVLLMDVLYYVPSPFDLLCSAHRRLSGQGQLVLRMNVWGGSAFLLSRLGRLAARARRLAQAMCCDHTVIYTPAGLRLALGNAGFRVLAEQVDPSHSWLVQQLSGWQLALLRGANPLLRAVSGNTLHMLPTPIVIAAKMPEAAGERVALASQAAANGSAGPESAAWEGCATTP